MIETPQIIETPASHTAFIHLVVSRDDIRQVMGPAISEVYSVLAAQGISSAGPWFTHHLRRPNETFDFRVSVPVSTPVTASGRVNPGQLPARKKVARTVYSGPYEGLGEAWAELMAWIADKGHTRAADLWECYAVGPESSPDPADWRTELHQPLED